MPAVQSSPRKPMTFPLQLGLLGLCANVFTVVSAQPSAEQDSHTASTVLEPITVSGELQTRGLQDTTTSVSVFSSEDVENSADFSLYDTFKRSANVTGVAGSGWGIRGITQDSVASNAYGRAINVSVDGANLPTSQSVLFGPYSTWDLEQVEVLRGPQSTQQGRNSLAGAINIRTANPTFHQESKIRLRAGERRESQLALMYNQPLNDKLAARFTFERSHTDGWVENPIRGEDDYDARDITAIRGKLLFELSERTRAIFSHNYTESSGGGSIISRPLFPDKRHNLNNEKTEEESKHNVTGLRIDHRINGKWSMVSETSYYAHESVHAEDYDGTSEDIGFWDRDTDDNTTTQEIKWRYSSDQLRAAVGLFMTRIRVHWVGSLETDANVVAPAVPAGAAIFTRTLDRRVDTDNYAIFGEVEYDWNSRWTTLLGARYDHEKLDAADATKYFLNPHIPGVLPADDDVAMKTDYEELLPKLGVIYRLNPNASVGLTLQRGYRAGGVDRNPVTLEVVEFNPEYTNNVELSWRSQWLDDRLQVNANVFHTDWKDQQVRVFGDTGHPLDSIIRNTGESTVQGGEVELRFQASETLGLYASLGHAKTEYDEFSSASGNFSGNRFAFAPEYSAALGGTWYVSDNWSVQLDSRYNSSFYSDPENTEANKVAGYFVLDARVGYETDRWSSVLYGRNLTDKDYATNYINESQMLSGEPRVLGLELNARF